MPAGTTLRLKGVSLDKYPTGITRSYRLSLEMNDGSYGLAIPQKSPDRIFHPEAMREEGIEVLRATP